MGMDNLSGQASKDSRDRMISWLRSNEAKDILIDLQRLLISHQALGPENGGDGEYEKAEALKAWLRDQGIEDIQSINAVDSRVSRKIRPNFFIKVTSNPAQPILWVMSHLDVVPPGDGWASDPFSLKIEGNKLIGRGSEDNHQGLCASILVLLALKKFKPLRESGYGILCVADEEVSNQYGILHVLEHENPFGPQDAALVPDGGSPDGGDIELAEKAVLWLKFRVQGVQTHASRPDLGKNSTTSSSALILKLRELYDQFPQTNELFTPVYSTFEATRREENIPNINTVPGEDIFYMDCRILPEVELNQVLFRVDELVTKVEQDYECRIFVEIVDRVEASSTDGAHPLLKFLQREVEEVCKVKPRLIGIGGSTVAAYLRQHGIPAVVWAKLTEQAHQPNEYSLVENTFADAEVILRTLLSYSLK
jgi:succinyl-diaminopimelate desuccinylase